VLITVLVAVCVIDRAGGAVMKQEQALLMRVAGTVAIFSRSSDRPDVGFCRANMPLGGVVKARGVDWYVTESILRHIRTTEF
jgi:hypothetical protein